MERGRAFQTTGAHCANALWPSFLDGLHGTESKALLPDRKLRVGTYIPTRSTR